MSNNYLGILLNPSLKSTQSKEAPIKKRGNSQNLFQRIPDIITQVKPSFLNNYSQPLNPHKSSFTPSNKTRDLLQSDLLLPMKSPEYTNKKTLILDLDETLVHSSPTPFPKNDLVLEVDFDGILYNIYVLIRPGAENFIKRMSKIFEIVVFTASISRYASPLLDILDKDKNIQYRLYREHCTFLNGIYIKELKRLNRDLKDVIIVDNSPLAFAFDTENGLPINSWYEDKTDNELERISILLEFLSKVDDIREYIELFVENNEIKYEQSIKFISSINNNIDNIIANKDKENDIINIKNINNDINNNDKNKKNNSNFSLHDLLNNHKMKGNFNFLNNNIKKSKTYKNILLLDENKIISSNSQKNINVINNKINLDKKDNNNTSNSNNNNNNNSNNNIFKDNKQSKRSSYKNKKNAFRFKQKYSQMSLKNLMGNTFGNNKLNSLFPLTLSLTNTTKMIQFKKRDSNMNNLKLVSIKDISNNNPISNSLSKKDIKNNIKKYTNLLEKLETNKNIYTNSLINNLNINQSTNYRSSNNSSNKKTNMLMTRNSKSFKLSQNKKLLINSSVVLNQQNQKGFSKEYKNNFLFPGTTNYFSNTSRSKSTGNFMNFNSKKREHPKTPKANQRFYKLDLFDDKNVYKFGGQSAFDPLGFSQTTRNRFTFPLKKNKDKIKIKRIGFKKDI